MIKKRNYTHKTKEDKSPAAGGGNFIPLPKSGFYIIEVTASKLSEYDSKKGVTYLKVQPQMRVISGSIKHIINRFDINVSAINDSGFYRPDGDDSKSPIWFLADSFFQSIGAYVVSEDGSSELQLDTDFMRGRVVKALFRYETYCKADKAWNLRSDGLDAWLKTEQGYSDADLLEVEYEELKRMFNEISEENGYPDDENIRIKSVPVKFWALSAEQAERDGYHPVDGVTFITEDDYNTYVGLQALIDIEDENEDDIELQL